MKTTYARLILLAALLTVYSCKLDETIYSNSTPENTIKTSADVDYLLYGAYSQLNYPQMFQRDIRRLTTPYADDLSSVQNTAMGVYGSKSGNNSAYSANYQVWATIYVAISNANAVLESLDKLNLAADYKAKAAGEAKFLRAFSYFLLVQMWGGVPIWTTVANGSSDFYTPRNSVDEVYKQIFADLTEAIPGLLTRSATPLYLPAKGAARGYLAKSYLTYANYLDLHNRAAEAKPYYQKAEDMANEVINSNEYQLIADYGKLWDVTLEKDSYNEVIFGVGFTHDPSNTTSAGEGSALPTDFMPTSIPNVAGTPTGRGGGNVKVHPWFIEKYTKNEYVNDYRVEKSFLLTWLDYQNKQRYTFPLIPAAGGVTESQAYINKYRDPAGLSSDGHENDMFLLRLAEIYLIKAEAENELNGPTATALAAFNTVRARARQANGTPRTNPVNLQLADVPTKEDMRLKIFDERGLEFVGEFNRWFDLVRMQYRNTGKTMYEYQFGTFLPTLTPGLPTYKNGAWSAGRTEPTNIVPYDPKYLLYPIPANELSTNPKLTQNPGW